MQFGLLSLASRSAAEGGEQNFALSSTKLSLMIGLIIIGVVAIVTAVFLINVFNRLARARVLTQEGWSGIGTFLQQRNDLLPNLVEVVKGYVGHENKTLTDVIKARNESVTALTPEAQLEAAKHMGTALINFKSLTEQYPDLKANENFLRLQSEVDEMEDKINQSRRYYNGTVRDYNSMIVVFPNNVVAGMFSFKEAPFFQEDAGAKTAPVIKF